MIRFEGSGSSGKHALFGSLLRRPFTRVSASLSSGSATGIGSPFTRLDGTRLHVAIVGMALFIALAFALLVSVTVSSRSADAQQQGVFDQPQICDGYGLFSQGITENSVNGTRFNSVDTEQVPFQFDRVSFQPFPYNALAYRATDNFVYGYRSDNVGGNDNRGLIRIDRQGDVQSFATPANLPKQTYSNAAIQQGTGLLYLYNNNGTTNLNPGTGAGQDQFIENQQVYVVNLNNNTVSTFQTVDAQGAGVRLNVIDFAFRNQDGLLYGADLNGNVVSLNPNTGLVTRTAVPNLPAVTGYGGAFFNQNGDLFVIGNFDGAANNGNFFQINLNGPTPQIRSRNTVPQSASNDAAACYLPLQPDPNNPGQTIGRPYNSDVKLTTQGPAQVEPGGPLTYTHTVLQSGPDNAQNVSVETTLPEGATYNPTGSGGDGWTCTAAPPNANDRVVVTCDRTDDLPLGNGPPLTVNAVAPDEPVNGPLVANAAVSVPDRNGEDSELDADEDDNTSQVSTNAGPDAVNDTYSVTIGDQLNITAAQGVLSNDTDINGDGLTVVDTDPNTPGIQPVTEPTKGRLTLKENGAFDYIPNAGASGTDTFTYRISDGNGGTDTATVTINLNRPPDAVNNTYTVQAGETLTVDAPGILGDDTDPDGDDITVVDGDGDAGNGISPVEGPTKGTLTLNTDGSFEYTPNAGATGTDTFTYRISDGNGGFDTATVTLNINRPPIAEDDAYTTPFETGLIGNVITNTENGGPQDRDPDGDTVRVIDADPNTPGIQPVSGPSNGRITLNPDGTFTYVPDDGFRGTDTFTYRIGDGNGGQDEATVTIDVQNAPPIAVDDTYTTPFETELTGNVITNQENGQADRDPNGDTLTVVDTDPGTPGVQPVTGPTNGILTLNADGTFSYTPRDGFSGTDTFTYRISDGNGGTDTATVTITVPNAPPNADNDSYNVQPGETLNVNAANGVLDGDTDPNTDANGDPTDTLRVIDGDGDPNNGLSPVSGPTKGSLTLNADGSFTYTPNAGATGTDTFTYRIGDGNGGTDEATVTLNLNRPPVAIDDVYAIPSTQPSISDNVLTNVENGDQDSDPDNDTLTVVDGDNNPNNGISPVSGPSNGTLTLNADGTFTYTPNPGFSGTDTFEYRISDGNGGFDVGKVFISVNGAPIARDDDYTTPFETRLRGNIITNPDGTDTDPDGDTLTVTDSDPNTPGVQPVSGPTNGTLVLRPDGTFVYTPNDGFSGTDTFTYTVTDEDGETSNVATVTITVPNAPPVARDNRYRTPFNTTLNQGTPGILANDSDPNGDTLTVADADPNTPGIQPVSGTRNGKLTLRADGSFKYVPNRGFRGTDTFTYRISDGNGGTDEATVTIVVDPKPASKADLQIKVNSPERVDQGDRFKYTLTIKNNGPDGARNVRAVSKIPPGVEFVSAPKGCKYNASNRTVTCNVGNLSDNQVKKLQITVRAVKPGRVTLRGCYVRSDTADPNSSNNSDT